MKIVFSVILVLHTFFLFCQSVGIGTITPNPSAALEVKSQSKGFLPPRMTLAERSAINSPAAGLVIYCTDSKVLQVYNGTNWQDITSINSNGSTSEEFSAVRICCSGWMTKNLDVTTYRNGDVIPEVEDSVQWASLTTGAWCYPNGSAAYSGYGKLYNWYAVNDLRGLAPVGWHIPTDFEWDALADCLGGTSVAGGKMKNISTDWQLPNVEATNVSGFSGFPAGLRNFNGSFNYLGGYGFWWSSTESSASLAWYRALFYDGGGIGKNNGPKNNSLSVRCVRD